VTLGRTEVFATQPRSHPKRYRRYEHYYRNEADVYTKLGQALKQPQSFDAPLKSAIKALRNPVHRVVEFYATVILTGTAKEAFPLGGTDEALARAIYLVWAWSNLDQRKQVLKRYTGIYGQSFIKVVSPKDAQRVHYQLMTPQPISDFEKDDRGNLVYVRIDSPFEKEEGQPPKRVKKVHTEVWRKGTKDKSGYYRTWERPEDVSEDTVPTEKSLGNPKVSRELSEARTKDSLGFDFVPFVDISAMDTGEKRPRPAYEHALPLVDENNRMATRLHDLLFRYNKPFKAVQGIGNDTSGRPMPPPQVQPQTQQFAGHTAHLLGEAGDDLSLGGDILFGLPGNAQLADVTPRLDFEAARNAILDMAVELREELPELLYYIAQERAQLSGRALRLLLAGAVDRASEMRANIHAGLIKANKMALTIAQVRGFPGFGSAQIGTYRRGEGFEHQIEPTEILPLSELEREEVRSRKIQNAAALISLGVKREDAMKEVGLEAGELESEPEGGVAQDELSRAAAALSRQFAGSPNGNGTQ
jgi:hypothetical protein